MPGTRLINARELKRQRELQGSRKVVRHLSEALEKGQVHPTDFSIRDLAESVVENGDEWVRSMQPRKSGHFHLLEAGSVNYADFSNITGQIFYTMVKESFESEALVFSKLIQTKTSTLLDEEKVPGIGRLGDKFGSPIPEGDAYPYMGVVEDYIKIGAKQKRGGIVAVTKEAVAGDRTGFLLQKCQELGEFLGINKEKRIIDTLIDGNSMAASISAGGSRYDWKGTSYAAYQASSPWINVKTSNALASWKSVEAAELILAAITDPFTGEPVLIDPTHIIVPPDLKHTAARVMSATNVQTHAGGYATSGDLQDYHAPSPLDPYKIVASKLFKARMAAAGQTQASTWYIGNPAKAVCYFSNWDIQTATMGAGSEQEFTRDVISQHKVSERGHPAWLEPRLMCKCTQ